VEGHKGHDRKLARTDTNSCRSDDLVEMYLAGKQREE